MLAHGRRGELDGGPQLRLAGGAVIPAVGRRSGHLLAAMLSVALLGPVGCTGRNGGNAQDLIPPPPPTAPVSTSPLARDYTDVALDPVPGLPPTASAEVLGGQASLSGIVLGPDGPLQGATVRLERLVDDVVGRLEVTSDEAGIWRAPPPTTSPTGPQGIRGGRYRVRAWRTPDLAVTAPQILFIEGTENREVTLELARFTDTSFSWSSSPDPPVLGSVVGFRVVADSAFVDSDGVVHTEAVLDARLDVGPGWVIVGHPTFTEGPGELTFELRCVVPGPSPVLLIVNDLRTLDLPVQACFDPAP